MKTFSICTLFVLFLGASAVFAQTKQSRGMNPAIPKGMKLDTIHVQGFSPRQAVQVIEHKGTNPVLIDVRSEQEFATGHLKGAINIPVEQLERRLKELKKYKKQTIITMCDNGTRGMQACGILVANHFEWAFYLKKGLTAWKAENLPMELPVK